MPAAFILSRFETISSSAVGWERPKMARRAPDSRASRRAHSAVIPRAPPVTTNTSRVVSGSSHSSASSHERAQNRFPAFAVRTVARFRVAACRERLCQHPRGRLRVFRRHVNHTRVEILRFKVQRAREAGRAATMLDKHETEIIATFQRLARAVQQEADVTLVGLGREENDDAAACVRLRERFLYSGFERMVWWCEYAPVSCLGRTISPRQSAFDEFDGKLSDPLINAGGLCFFIRVAGRARVCAAASRALAISESVAFA